MESKGKTVDARYSDVFKKVILSYRIYDKECDTELESKMYFTYGEVKEVINMLQDSLMEMADKVWTERHLIESNS